MEEFVIYEVTAITADGRKVVDFVRTEQDARALCSVHSLIGLRTESCNVIKVSSYTRECLDK